jgi:hypothetical protein
MKRLSGIICLFLVVTWPQLSLTGKDQAVKRTEFGVGREAGYGLEEFPDGSCILFRVFYISDSFFSNISRVDAPTGLKFKKAGKPVEFFPEHLVLNVEANVYSCGEKPVQRPPLDFKSDLMKSLLFRLQWKREFDLRPVDVTSMQSRGPVVYLFSNRWEYFMEVSAKQVPLSDSLVIDILGGKNGDGIRRLSARV